MQMQYSAEYTQVVPVLAQRKYVSISMLRKVRRSKDLMPGLLFLHLVQPPLLWKRAKTEMEESQKLLDIHFFSFNLQKMSLGKVHLFKLCDKWNS